MKTTFKRKESFFEFSSFHLRTKCVFNIFKLIIFNVLTLLFMYNIELKWMKI